MFFVSGTREQIQRAGFVAEFCPICRLITPCLLMKRGAADHVYGISLGVKETLGHRLDCQHCGTSVPVDAAAYQGTVDPMPGSVEELIRLTFPNILTARAERLRSEDRLRAGQATPLQRRQALLEPFRVLFPVSEDLGQGIHLGGRAAGAFIGSFVLAAVVLIGGGMVLTDPAQRGWLVMAALGIVLAGAIACVVLALRYPAQAFAKRVMPNLVKSLTPLKPTRGELSDCLTRLKRADYKIGSQAKLELLCQALQLPEPAVVQLAARN